MRGTVYLKTYSGKNLTDQHMSVWKYHMQEQPRLRKVWTWVQSSLLACRKYGIKWEQQIKILDSSTIIYICLCMCKELSLSSNNQHF